MASGGTRAAAGALLFCFFFSGVVVLLLVLLQAPRRPGLSAADLLVAARDRFLDGRGRGVLELATRRNMILLCHAILLLILRDAGVLGAPAARRRSCRSPPGEDATPAAAVDVAQTACSAVVPVAARPHATRTAVVWRRRPRNRAAAAAAPTYEHSAAAAARRLVVECHPEAEAAATWAAPVLTTGPPAQAPDEAAAVATKGIVLAELPRIDRHDRAVVVQQLERPTAIAAVEERDCCDDRRIIAVDDEKSMNDTSQQTAGTELEMEMEMELADDRTFEEFIKSQRRQMRQESLQLDRSGSGYHYQSMIAACY